MREIIIFPLFRYYHKEAENMTKRRNRGEPSESSYYAYPARHQQALSMVNDNVITIWFEERHFEAVPLQVSMVICERPKFSKRFIACTFTLQDISREEGDVLSEGEEEEGEEGEGEDEGFFIDLDAWEEG